MREGGIYEIESENLLLSVYFVSRLKISLHVSIHDGVIAQQRFVGGIAWVVL